MEASADHHTDKPDGSEEFREIIERVAQWAGGEERATAWYRTVPLTPLGGLTAEALVEGGRAKAVHEYLDHLANGGFT